MADQQATSKTGSKHVAHVAPTAPPAPSATAATTVAPPSQTPAPSGSIESASLAILFVFLAWLFLRKRAQKGGSSRTFQVLEKAGVDWAQSITAAGQFPRADPGILLVPKSEYPLLMEQSQLHIVGTETARGYVGTRVKIGGTPLYFGGSKPTSKAVLKAASTGALMLTSRKLVFSGKLKTETILIEKIVAVDPMADAIRVTVEGKAKPVYFSVGNPLIWTVAIRSASRFDLSNGTLPADFSF